jgi:hypothetical protein
MVKTRSKDRFFGFSALCSVLLVKFGHHCSANTLEQHAIASLTLVFEMLAIVRPDDRLVMLKCHSHARIWPPGPVMARVWFQLW